MRLGKILFGETEMIRACVVKWVFKLRDEIPNHSLCRTEDLRGVPRCLVFTLTHPVDPSAGGLDSSVDLSSDEDVGLEKGRPGTPRADMLHSGRS